MKIALITAAALTVGLAGCLGPDAQDRVALTKFRVNPDRTFTYTNDATVDPGKTLAETKPTNERWLQDWLTANDMCPNGYRIVQTTGAKTGGKTIWGGDLYTADFTGKCL